MKLSKKILFWLSALLVARRKRKRFAVVTWLPFFIRNFAPKREQSNTVEKGSKRSTKFLVRSPKTRRCKINSSLDSLWKTTPFSKLWAWVIWSEEVAKIIAPNRFDKMGFVISLNSRDQRIYDLLRNSPLADLSARCLGTMARRKAFLCIH